MKHGGDLSEAAARYGGPLDSWLDLSTGINSVPWPVADKHFAQTLYSLPSRADEAALIDAARAAYRVTPEADIAIAPGTQALIQWLPRIATAGAVAIVAPTYSEHAQSWAHGGRDIITCNDVREIGPHIRHAVIVNPNNPDGRTTPLDIVADIATALRDRGGWLVVDEAFADVEPELSAATLCTNLPVLVLRSFGKFYGLPGLRLGFAIAAPAIVQDIRHALGPWPVSGPALAIGTAALRDDAWAANARRSLKQRVTRLDAVLKSAGCAIVGGTNLFRLVRHDQAGALHERLAGRHIWCRTFDWNTGLLRFGLPADDEGFNRLAKALA